MTIIIRISHSFHFLIFPFTSIPHPSQSQSTLYSHQPTRLPLPLLFPPVTVLLMAVLLLYMFRSTVGRSKCSYTLLEIEYFYGLKKLVTFGVPNRILKDTRTELFNPNKSGTAPRKQGKQSSLGESYACTGLNTGCNMQ